MPDVVLREGTDVFLDDISKKDIETALGIKAKIIESTPGGNYKGNAGGQMKISGKTKVLGLLGFPVGHSLSPTMHNTAFEKLGLDCCYVTFSVKPEFYGMR